MLAQYVLARIKAMDAYTVDTHRALILRGVLSAPMSLLNATPQT